MAAADGVIIRGAGADDVRAVCEFGETVVRPHHTPLIGAQAANEQVARWWNDEQIGAAVSSGIVVVAETQDRVVAIAQHGRNGVDHVIYKLYVHPGCRGRGLGPRLIAAVLAALPPEASRICVEHFASNVRAAAFYEREGFAVARVQQSVTGDPALDVVWRTRDIDRSTTTDP